MGRRVPGPYDNDEVAIGVALLLGGVFERRRKLNKNERWRCVPASGTTPLYYAVDWKGWPKKGTAARAFIRYIERCHAQTNTGGS